MAICNKVMSEELHPTFCCIRGQPTTLPNISSTARHEYSIAVPFETRKAETKNINDPNLQSNKVWCQNGLANRIKLWRSVAETMNNISTINQCCVLIFHYHLDWRPSLDTNIRSDVLSSGTNNRSDLPWNSHFCRASNNQKHRCGCTRVTVEGTSLTFHAVFEVLQRLPEYVRIVTDLDHQDL